MTAQSLPELVKHWQERAEKAEAETMRLQKAMWGWVRGLKGPKPYTEDELREMFRPYVEDGDTTGLSPREVRLLETLIATGAEVSRLRERQTLTYCAFCGEQFPIDNDAGSQVEAHIKVCEKHPMKAVLAENVEFRQRLAASQKRVEELEAVVGEEPC